MFLNRLKTYIRKYIKLCWDLKYNFEVLLTIRVNININKLRHAFSLKHI